MFGDTRGDARVTFDTTGITDGDPCDEILYLKQSNPGSPGSSGGEYDLVDELVVLAETAPPTGAAFQVDVLKAGGKPGTDADWITNVASGTAAGIYEALQLAGKRGVRVRCIRGTADGTWPLSVSWRG